MDRERVNREIDSEKVLSKCLHYRPGNQCKEMSFRYSLKTDFLPKRQKLYCSYHEAPSHKRYYQIVMYNIWESHINSLVLGSPVEIES